MPTARLAQELLDSIIDDVQERGALKACSLAGRSLVVPTQRRLFRSICLFTAGSFLSSPPKASHHLASSLSSHGARDLFTMSPHLGSYVKELYLGLVFMRDYYVVESVLPAFQKITHLGIFSDGGASQWNNIPDIASASPYIPSPSCAGLSSSLERLTISTTTNSRDDKSVFEMDMHRHLKGIRKLSLLDIHLGDKHWMPFLLEPALRPTVQHLELSFKPFQTVPELALPPFLALRSLEITLDIRDIDDIGPALDSVLANIHTTAPLLECLSLTLRLWTSASWSQECDPCPSFASLEFMERLAALQEVHCSLKTNSYRYEERFEQYMRRIFTGPKEAGILSCSIIRSTSSLP
ncbi:hypothetical protein C8R44DRAFT_868647 [Mycena epipterygia]|nr:hypothetical protein C8R44DRAFT_868647 [Mycena epipterygia]